MSENFLQARESDTGRTLQILSHVAKLEARVADLEKEVVRQVEEFISIVSHLEGPHHCEIKEPGNYIHLIKVFNDRSGFVTEFKKCIPDNSQDAQYPCREWREWMKDRPQWPLIPFKDYTDMKEKTT